jgi:hypothetical protein
MPPREREPRVATLEVLDHRQAVHHNELRHALWVVEREPVRDQAPSVVPADREALVTELGHKHNEVAGHRALGVRLVVRCRRRLRRLAVAAEVGADDREIRREQTRDLMPRVRG